MFQRRRECGGAETVNTSRDVTPSPQTGEPTGECERAIGSETHRDEKGGVP